MSAISQLAILGSDHDTWTLGTINFGDPKLLIIAIDLLWWQYYRKSILCFKGLCKSYRIANHHELYQSSMVDFPPLSSPPTHIPELICIFYYYIINIFWSVKLLLIINKCITMYAIYITLCTNKYLHGIYANFIGRKIIFIRFWAFILTQNRSNINYNTKYSSSYMLIKKKKCRSKHFRV